MSHINAESPAFPITLNEGEDWNDKYCPNGLTKREYIATQLMCVFMESDPTPEDTTAAAVCAVCGAETLLAELAKGQPNG